VRSRWLVSVVVVATGAAVVAVVGLILHTSQWHQPILRARVSGTVQTDRGTLPHAFLSLATYPDSQAGEHGPGGGDHPDWVSYGPSTNLEVPAHSVVTITIRQYDSGEELIDPFFGHVRGTLGNTLTLNGKTLPGINPDHVAHTFTLRALPGDSNPDFFVSVPLAPTPDDAPAQANGYPKPEVITFSFAVGGPGKYVWNCEFPCGTGYQGFGGPMSTLGYMAGTLTVT
jgi:hypothetical protein